MSNELDLETRIDLALIGLNAVKIKLNELDKQMAELESWLASWKR